MLKGGDVLVLARPGRFGMLAGQPDIETKGESRVMGRRRVVQQSGQHFAGDQPVPERAPVLTRSLAGAIAVGAPVGIIVWLAVEQMPNITWAVTQLFQHTGQ